MLMTADIMPHGGDFVEFADKGKIQLGIAMDFDEKSSKCRVLNASAREQSLPRKQIMHVLRARIDTALPLSNLTREIRSVDARADHAMEECRVDELWALVQEEESVDLDTLASLVFQEPDTVQTLAMIRALRNDKVYFKATTPDVFVPRPQSVVDDLIRQAEAKARKLEWRGRFADEAREMLSLAEEERDRRVDDGLFPSVETRDAWRIVEDYAIWGIEAKDKPEAEALMECLQARLNRGFAGTAHIRARSLLRECGYWSADTSVALRKYEIATSFSSEVESAAFGLYQNPAVGEGRADFTDLCVFSIDDPETLDIDDALSIDRLEDGRLRLGVHIAAPAASIPFDGVLEREARHRATSIYLPEQRIPMLPVILSENVLSLMPGERRNAMSFMITFDAEYNIVDRAIVPSVVRSSHRLSYDAAESMIEDGNDDLSDRLRLIQEITEYSAANRRSHGAIEIDLPEFKLTWDGTRYELHEIDGSMMSRVLVSECMILANALAADFCSEHGIPVLYRIQPPPANMPGQEALDALPNDLIRAYTMRRCMMPAASSMTPGLHAGLGLDRYTQATSPLRRYADLICHYQLEAWFAQGAPRFDADACNAVLAETDLGLSHARAASHEGMQTATLQYLQQLGSEPIEAIVVQYIPDRNDVAQVCLVQTQVRANLTIKSHPPVGTMCTVRIDTVKPEEGVILLQFVEALS